MMINTVGILFEATLEMNQQQMQRRCLTPDAATICGWHIYSRIFRTFAHTFCASSSKQVFLGHLFADYVFQSGFCQKKHTNRSPKFPENDSNPPYTTTSVDS